MKISIYSCCLKVIFSQWEIVQGTEHSLLHCCCRLISLLHLQVGSPAICIYADLTQFHNHLQMKTPPAFLLGVLVLLLVQKSFASRV